MSTNKNSSQREQWSHALAAKGRAGHLPQPKVNAFRAGLGPNKASGHKGGISRQDSKRG